MMDINEYLAKECGVELHPVNSMWKLGEHWILGSWNYKKPRCREIIREKLKLTTEVDDDGAYCWDTVDVTFTETGKTIAEAECKTIEAIYKACLEQLGDSK